MKTIKMLEQFLNDENGWEMFITGPAGTGKTTQLRNIVKWLEENNISYVVTAFTHKACDVIKSKIKSDKVQTLHSFLKVVPMPNEETLSKRRVTQTAQVKKPNQVQLLIVDEFSMINEKDVARIEELQDPEYEGTPKMKVLYIGDLNQLPPVDGEACVYPKEPYWIKLTKVWRQEGNTGLLDTLTELNKMIQGEVKPHALEPNDSFIRNVDLVEKWKEVESDDKVILAYTNKKVQEYNFALKGSEPIMDDIHFCPTTHWYVKYLGDTEEFNEILARTGIIAFGSKYRTLEYLVDTLSEEHSVKFGLWYIEELDEIAVMPYVFGHYNYKQVLELLSDNIIEVQKEIKTKYNPASIKHWAKANSHDNLARKRAKAWRDYLTFTECVVCIDHNIATTIHKSQGSTYDYVFIDGDDVYKCPDSSLYLKLLYVAMSRARNKIFLNN